MFMAFNSTEVFKVINNIEDSDLKVYIFKSRNHTGSNGTSIFCVVVNRPLLLHSREPFEVTYIICDTLGRLYLCHK